MAQENNQKNDKYQMGVFYTKIYRVIPPNCVLLVRNKFLGKNITVKKGGFAFVAPWKEAKLISIAERVIDYPKIEFDDKEGQSIFIDYAISVRIVNPIKYEYSHQNIDEALKIMLTSAMRVLIRKASWEEMAGKNFEISRNGSKSTVDNTDFGRELDRIKVKLNQFTNKYGLEIVSLMSKDVQQSPEMQKAYDEKVKAIKEGEAKKEAALKQQEVAKIDAETRKINATADAEAQKIMNKAIVANLKDALISIKDELSGLSDEQIIRIINTYLLTNGSNKHTNVFSSVSNNDIVKLAIANNSTLEQDTDVKAPKQKK